MRATSNVRDRSGSPFSIRQILAVVPPMSSESASASPQSRATWPASMTPPAGPDSTSRTGNLAAFSSVVSPPPDIIMKNGHVRPRAPRLPRSLWR